MCIFVSASTLWTIKVLLSRKQLENNFKIKRKLMNVSSIRHRKC